VRRRRIFSGSSRTKTSVPWLAYEDTVTNAFYLVMPFASGGSLFSKVRSKTLTEFETRNFASQALSAVEHVHKLGYVHADIKPHNFLLNPVEGKFHVWLCDFGFADPLGADGSVAFLGVRGTFGYFAPEMIKQKDFGPPVDIFALGVTVHNLLVGYAPFDPPSHFKGFEFEPRYWKHMSNASRDIVAGMLHLDPAARLTAAAAAGHEWFSADVAEEQKVEKYVSAPDARLKFHRAGSVPPLAGLADLLREPTYDLANPNEPEDLPPLSPIRTVATAPGQLTARPGGAALPYAPPVRSASNNRLTDLARDYTWEAHKDEQGRTYYWNAKRRVKTYDWSLPDGWEAHKDDQGRTYYWNATRKIKTYNRDAF